MFIDKIYINIKIYSVFRKILLSDLLIIYKYCKVNIYV